MRVEIVREPKFQKIDHLFIILAEGDHLDVADSVKAIAKPAIAAAGFTGRSDESITILRDQPKKVTLLGLGKKDAISIRGLRGALYSAAKIAKKQKDKNIAVLFPYALPTFSEEETLRLAADYLSHADYKYDRFITVKKDEKQPSIHAVLIAPASADAKKLRDVQKSAIAISDGVRTVRDLGNAPSNIVTPTTLAERAVEVAKETGIKCTVFGKKDIVRMKMGGLIAVNRGSVEEPKFIVLEYTPKRSKKHVALVGKGITFDSGGISIKPSERMEEMKFDMCGAAAVIGTMEAAAKLGLPVKITGYIPSTDNLPSGSAYKPGEIITMMSGKTVEIVNTDAEGRMILGDALHYASLQKPDHMLDYATLTGACVVALGGEASGLFSNDDELARKLIECGERAGDRLWRMPVWDEYKDLIRSEWADMKNSGGRWGGAISAAVFLKEFVDCPSWAHLDIAGTANTEHDTGRENRGATGAGVRVTIGFLESLSRS
jgi:leucyl aminopeptidase